MAELNATCLITATPWLLVPWWL